MSTDTHTALAGRLAEDAAERSSATPHRHSSEMPLSPTQHGRISSNLLACCRRAEELGLEDAATRRQRYVTRRCLYRRPTCRQSRSSPCTSTRLASVSVRHVKPQTDPLRLRRRERSEARPGDPPGIVAGARASRGPRHHHTDEPRRCRRTKETRRHRRDHVGRRVSRRAPGGAARAREGRVRPPTRQIGRGVIHFPIRSSAHRRVHRRRIDVPPPPRRGAQETFSARRY